MAETKHISILGCCCSRNMFNYSPLDNIFKVECYAFQVLPWACFQPKLDISEIDINKIDDANFTKRMLTYELNKNALSKIKEAKSEYLLIDLLTSTFDTIKISFKGITTYIRNAYLDVPIKKLQLMPQYKEIKYEIIPFDSIDRTMIFEGIIQLANWIKANFEQNKVIIYNPRYAKKYLDNRQIRINYYNEFDLEKYQKREAFNDEITNLLLNELPHANYYTVNKDELIAYDKNQMSSPSGLHYVPRNFIFQGYELLRCIGYKINDSVLECMDVYYEKQILKLNNEESLLLKNNSALESHMKEFLDDSISLNVYFNMINKMNDIVIIICAKDDASVYFNKINRKLFNMSLTPKFRDSYIMIYNKNENYLYENKSQDYLITKYQIYDKCVFIESGGYNSGISRAAILVDGNNLAKNKRGLNICIFNTKTGQLIESTSCDLYADPYIKIKTNLC